MTFFFLVVVFPAHASNIEIRYIDGTVFLRGNKITKDHALHYGDTITTGENSLIIIKLEEYSTIKINELSSLKLVKPQKIKGGRIRRGVILKAGSVFVKAVQKVLKEDNSSLVLKTKIASMGVRGTEFFTSYANSTAGKDHEDIWMCVKEGQVVVKNRKTKTLVKVNEGEGVQVPFGKNTTSPRPLAWTEKLNWSMNPNGDVKNTVDISQAYYDLLNVDYD